MSERATYRLVNQARDALQYIVSNLVEEGPGDPSGAVVVLANLLLKSASGLPGCTAKERSMLASTPLRRLAGDLRGSLFRTFPNGTPAAVTATAIMHLSERLLGLRPSGNTLASLPSNTLVHRARSRPFGTYSTPDFVADLVTSDLMTQFHNDSCEYDVADLSVEAGHFALSVLANRRSKRIQFYGIDRDPTAVEVARTIMRWAIGVSEGDQFHFRCRVADSIIDPLPNSWPRQFDAIIGNPPWKTLHSTDDKELRQKYCGHLRAHFDVCLAFILRADELLREGGYMSLVIPSGFLFNQNARTVRDVLLDSYRIIRLTIFPRRSFIELPSVTPVSFLAQKIGSRSPGKGRTQIRFAHSKLGHRGRTITIRRDAQSVWRRLPGHVFNPSVRLSDCFLTRLEGDGCLRDYGVLLSGAMLGNRLPVSTPRAFVGVHARHLRPFHACLRHAIAHDVRTKAFDRVPPLEYVDVPKILFQDMRCMTLSTRLIAAIAGKGVLPVNTASMFVPEDEPSAHFFEALLNSHLANAWFKIRDSNRDIRLSVLVDLPVAHNRAAWSRIAGIGRQIAAVRRFFHRYLRNCNVRNETATLKRRFGKSVSKMSALLDALNSEVYDLYGMTPTQRSAIHRLSTYRTF